MIARGKARELGEMATGKTVLRVATHHLTQIAHQFRNSRAVSFLRTKSIAGPMCDIDWSPAQPACNGLPGSRMRPIICPGSITPPGRAALPHESTRHTVDSVPTMETSSASLVTISCFGVRTT